jgi:hypothetical protein
MRSARKPEPGRQDPQERQELREPPTLPDTIARLEKDDPKTARQLVEMIKLQWYGWQLPTEFWRTCAATGGRTPSELQAGLDKYNSGFLAAQQAAETPAAEPVTEAETPAAEPVTEAETPAAEPVTEAAAKPGKERKSSKRGPQAGETAYVQRERENLIPTLQAARQKNEGFRHTIRRLEEEGRLKVPGAGDRENMVGLLARAWTAAIKKGTV